MKKNWGHFSKGVSFANFLWERVMIVVIPFCFDLLQKKQKWFHNYINLSEPPMLDGFFFYYFSYHFYSWIPPYTTFTFFGTCQYGSLIQITIEEVDDNTFEDMNSSW